MNCDPNSLIEAAQCYSCLTNAEQRAAQIYLLCQWSNHLTAPIDWSPASSSAFWIDMFGAHNGDLATFLATADIPTVSVLTAGTIPLTSITGLQNLTSLGTLNLPNNSLTSLDVSGMATLTVLNSTPNPLLTTIDVTGCTALTTFDCSNCDITGTLNVSGLTNLVTLNCSVNANMSGLDVSGCTALQSLNCNTCNITGTLDLSGLANLTGVVCDNNNISDLDLTGCTALNAVSCIYNSIATLDVSTCVALVNLDCSYNSMTTLTGTSGLPLQFLICVYNSLSSIDISGCVLMEDLIAFSNNLTTGAGGSVNIILTDMVINAPPPVGQIDLFNQTPLAPPDAGPPDGATAKTTLIGLGWVVNTD